MSSGRGYRIIERDVRSAKPRGIDYARMGAEYPAKRQAVLDASKSGDAVATSQACIDAMILWEECGAWPDNWSDLQRALDDTLHWTESVPLGDLESGRIRLVRVPEDQR